MYNFQVIQKVHMKHSIYYYLYTHFTCNFFICVKSVFITSFVLLFFVLYGSVIFVSYVLIRFCTSSLNAVNNAASPVSFTSAFLYFKVLYKTAHTVHVLLFHTVQNSRSLCHLRFHLTALH